MNASEGPIPHRKAAKHNHTRHIRFRRLLRPSEVDEVQLTEDLFPGDQVRPLHVDREQAVGAAAVEVEVRLAFGAVATTPLQHLPEVGR